MELNNACIVKIDEATYRFDEAVFGESVYMYFLVGQEKALLIDTGYGFTDVPAAIRAITDLPLMVVNTHGHIDHMHGNHLYPEVYLSIKDEDVFVLHNDKDYLMAMVEGLAADMGFTKEALNAPEMNVDGIVTSYPSVHKPLPGEMFFELGERKVSICTRNGAAFKKEGFYQYSAAWDSKHKVTLEDGKTARLLFSMQEM